MTEAFNGDLSPRHIQAGLTRLQALANQPLSGAEIFIEGGEITVVNTHKVLQELGGTALAAPEADVPFHTADGRFAGSTLGSENWLG